MADRSSPARNCNVVDLKLHMAVRWFIGGKVDHIPATIFAGYPKLMRVHDAVRDHRRREILVRESLRTIASEQRRRPPDFRRSINRCRIVKTTK